MHLHRGSMWTSGPHAGRTRRVVLVAPVAVALAFAGTGHAADRSVPPTAVGGAETIQAGRVALSPVDTALLQAIALSNSQPTVYAGAWRVPSTGRIA